MRFPNIFGNFFGLAGGKSTPNMTGNGMFDAQNLRQISVKGGYGGDKNNRERAAFLNDLDGLIESGVAGSVYAARFKWEGKAVENVYRGYIESVIYRCGFCVATDIAGFPGFFPAAVVGWDYMQQPNRFSIISNSDISGSVVSIEDCVVIKDSNLCQIMNQTGWPVPSVLAERYASKIADLGRAIEVYVNGLKRPIIIATTDKKALTDQSNAQSRLDNEPYLLIRGRRAPADESLDLQFQNQTHNGQDLLALQNEKNALTGEMFAKLGLSAVAKTKNAYVSGEELERQETFSDMIAEASFDNRRFAVEQMKAKFGWEIKVENSVEDLEVEGLKAENAESKDKSRVSKKKGKI